MGTGGTGAGTGGAATGGTSSGGPGDGLGPGLQYPPGDNDTCSNIGGSCSDDGDPGICRLYNDSEGRCETCTSCSGRGQFCTSSSDCDILFHCYQNKCVGHCPLMYPQVCGNPSDCVDIGHPDTGVCLN